MEKADTWKIEKLKPTIIKTTVSSTEDAHKKPWTEIKVVSVGNNIDTRFESGCPLLKEVQKVPIQIFGNNPTITDSIFAKNKNEYYKLLSDYQSFLLSFSIHE